MSSHTPGPWKVCEVVFKNGKVERWIKTAKSGDGKYEDGKENLIIHPDMSIFDFKKEDAHLIAAAPECLALSDRIEEEKPNVPTTR